VTASIVLLDPSDEAIITCDWSDAVGTTTLGAVTHNVPAPLTKMSEATDSSGKTSQVKVKGGIHGGMYMIEGQTTLSNGEVLNRQYPVRWFNG
jgi:hypothetical protein